MKVINNCIRQFKNIDLFGEKCTFKYKNHEKYSTGLGGIIFLLLCLVGITISILNLIPFCKRENISLQFYTVKLNETENIQLNEPIYFAIGLDCAFDNEMKITGRDLFDLKIKFTRKNKENKTTQQKDIITDFLNESLFYEKNKENLDYLETKDFITLNVNDTQDLKIEGIYTDKIFSYISIAVVTKETTKEHYNKINDYLLKNECRLQFYYSDITVNINNYKELSKPFIDSTFLQINPHLLMKKNVFFMKYHFKYDTRLFPILDFEIEEEEKIGFSRSENYFIYKGLNRDDTIPDSYEYAKLYIRVDNKKVEIKKEYQSFLEFWADNSSLWLDIFTFINFIISFIYNYKSSRILSKKLFIFEDNKDNEVKNLQIRSIINKIKLRKSNTHANMNLDEQRIYNSNAEYLTKSIQFSQRNTKMLRTKSIYTREFFKVLFCSCCKDKNELDYKEQLIIQSTDIIEKKLDIFIYLRNMILIDILFQILIDDNNKEHINFLSRILNYKAQENEKEEEKNIYKPIAKLDLGELYNSFLAMVKKPEKEKTENEKKIISLFNDKNLN